MLDSRCRSCPIRRRNHEATVKRAPLADYRIVYFATHGLVASDINGLAEPSLALTIPPQPSDLDDGLLTASEVAQLKLNADWVVLSACNTIAGDKPGAEALSGLALAFFYAGAHALLVALVGRLRRRGAVDDRDLRSWRIRSERQPRGRGVAHVPRHRLPSDRVASI
jgi:CHAT domain